MRAAAHHMVRFMTAGMALITCREPLLISISNNLRSNFLAALRVSAATLTCIMRSVPFYARQKACPQGGDGTCFSHLGIPVSSRLRFLTSVSPGCCFYGVLNGPCSLRLLIHYSVATQIVVAF